MTTSELHPFHTPILPRPSESKQALHAFELRQIVTQTSRWQGYDSQVLHLNFANCLYRM